jgi:hypothetical protein
MEKEEKQTTEFPFEKIQTTKIVNEQIYEEIKVFIEIVKTNLKKLDSKTNKNLIEKLSDLLKNLQSIIEMNDLEKMNYENLKNILNNQIINLQSDNNIDMEAYIRDLKKILQELTSEETSLSLAHPSKSTIDKKRQQVITPPLCGGLDGYEQPKGLPATLSGSHC